MNDFIELIKYATKDSGSLMGTIIVIGAVCMGVSWIVGAFTGKSGGE